MTSIDLIGDVDDSMVRRFITQLKQTNDSDTLLVTVCTDGGDVYCALAIYDMLILNKDRYKIKVVAIGKCFSAGNIILQAGDIREALPNTEFLIRYGFETTQSDTEKRHNNKIDKKIRTIIGKNTTVNKRTINSWFKQETYFNANEAVERGIITGITK